MVVQRPTCESNTSSRTLESINPNHSKSQIVNFSQNFVALIWQINVIKCEAKFRLTQFTMKYSMISTISNMIQIDNCKELRFGEKWGVAGKIV